MESGADDVFLSSDVDLDVRLKVCAVKSTVSVSYTHLTLPPNTAIQFSFVPVASHQSL